jgi:hypothetical protein
VARGVLEVRRSDSEMKRNAEIGLFTKSSLFERFDRRPSEEPVVKVHLLAEAGDPFRR